MRRNWPSQGGQPKQKALPEQRPGGVNTHGTFRNFQQSSGEEKQAGKGKLFVVKGLEFWLSLGTWILSHGWWGHRRVKGGEWLGQIWFRKVTLKAWSKEDQGLRATRKGAAACSRPEIPSPCPPKSLWSLNEIFPVLPAPGTLPDHTPTQSYF